MAFLGKARKEDLRVLADELGEKPAPDLKVIELKTLITNSKSYEEEFVRGLLDTIVDTRKAGEEAESRKMEMEMESRKMEFELRKLEIEGRCASVSLNRSQEIGESKPRFELNKIMPRFSLQDDDVVLYLSLFERQAKRCGVDKKDYVSHLVMLLPVDMVQLIARESEEKCDDYGYIKSILLKRFKMNSESFRNKFVQHQRDPSRTWIDFVFEVSNYFQGWIDGLEIKDFDGLRDLVIADQVKRRVPHEVREHFLDEWAKIVSPTELADKLDEYESVRINIERPAGANPGDRREVTEKWKPRPPPLEKGDSLEIVVNTPGIDGNPVFTISRNSVGVMLRRDVSLVGRRDIMQNFE